MSCSLLSVSPTVSHGASILNLQSRKFHDDGTPRVFPGCTWVSALDGDSGLSKALKNLQSVLRQEFPRLARHYTFLPPESFHVTVFDGLSPGKGIDLSEGLPTWEQSVVAVAQRAKQSPAAMKPPPLCVRPTRFNDALSVVLLYGDFADLRRWRQRVSWATGLPCLEPYEFHITIAYLQWPLGRSVELAKELAEARARLSSLLCGTGYSDLNPPELCRFNDMHAFHPIG